MMEKSPYEKLKLSVWVYEEDVITASTPDNQASYDDTGAWKDDWFANSGN